MVIAGFGIIAAMFTENEAAFLAGHAIGRLATASVQGQPHVVPVLFTLDVAAALIKIGSRDLPDRGQRRKYVRDCADNPRVAFVVDDRTPAGPRGVVVHGLAEVHATGGEELVPGGGPVWVEITPSMISSWGIDTQFYAPPNRREVGPA